MVVDKIRLEVGRSVNVEIRQENGSILIGVEYPEEFQGEKLGSQIKGVTMQASKDNWIAIEEYIYSGIDPEVEAFFRDNYEVSQHYRCKIPSGRVFEEYCTWLDQWPDRKPRDVRSLIMQMLKLDSRLIAAKSSGVHYVRHITRKSENDTV